MSVGKDKGTLCPLVGVQQLIWCILVPAKPKQARREPESRQVPGRAEHRLRDGDVTSKSHDPVFSSEKLQHGEGGESWGLCNAKSVEVPDEAAGRLNTKQTFYANKEFVWWHWGLNLGPRACRAGLYHLSHVLSSPSALVIFQAGSHILSQSVIFLHTASHVAEIAGMKSTPSLWACFVETGGLLTYSPD
jgi:hypothetical protein